MCLGGSSEPRLLGDAHGRAVGRVGGVRFRRGRDIDHRLREREFAFGRAEEIVGVLGGIGDRPAPADRPGRCPRPPCAPRGARGRADPRRHRACGRDNRAPRRDRSRAPTCAAPRSDCSGRPAPCRRSARAAARSPAAPPRRRSRPSRAARQTSSASVSAARPSPSAMRDQRRARLRVERQRPALDLLGARQQLLDRRRVERLEHQHARARQQRAR